MAEPLAKKQRTVEAEAKQESAESASGQVDAPAKEASEAVPTELEKDALQDTRPRQTDVVTFREEEMTLNVMPSIFGNMLAPLTEGGLQYLLCGARASVGVKSGRYMFEAKIVEFVRTVDDPESRNRSPKPGIRVGFCVAGSSLFLGDSEGSVCFDADGSFVYGRKKTTLPSAKFGRHDVVSVLLNLDDASPNSNTMSLFKDGKRVTEPQKLPLALHGKVLYPAFTFRNLTVYYNFGAAPPLVQLPFQCLMLQDAAEADVVVTTATRPKDGKYEVLFPVCLPDEGTFDWLDHFLEQHREYTELSDRAIVAWAEKSGLVSKSPSQSNDKPEFKYGLPFMDDFSVRRVLQTVAPLHKRNYIVMEVRASLLKEERKRLIEAWDVHGFRTTALVMVGEPPSSMRTFVQALMLKRKQEEADAEFQRAQAEAKRKKVAEKRVKEFEKAKLKARKKAEKAEEERRKKSELEKKRKEAAEKGETFEEPEEEEKEEEPELEDEEEKEEEMDVDPPKVSLTPEEEAQWFRKGLVSDLTPAAFSSSYLRFTLPDETDGFDEIRHEWLSEVASKDFLKTWIQERKSTTRIEDLTPSDWFTSRLKEWQKVVQGWQGKHTAYKAVALKKLAEDSAAKEAKAKAKREKAEARATAVAEKKAAAEAKAAEARAADAEETGEGEAKADEPEGEENMEVEEEKKEEEEEEEEQETKAELGVNFEELDVFGVEDICDIEGGQPLFSAFAYEDWTMMSLRFELHLLVHAFKRDITDPDMGVHVDHLAFYYNRYFKKALHPKIYGKETTKELLMLVEDTVVITRKQFVEARLPIHLESHGLFVMITEECRRERTRRIDLGDDSARLKITQPGVLQAGTPLNHPGSQLTALRPVLQIVPRGDGNATPHVLQSRPRPPQQGWPTFGAGQTALRTTTSWQPTARPFQPQLARPWGR
eukprot:TRINITY_DN6263_c4_g1_i1.p1 TRINITY_DN6263_c4_g1~~TRINITY_DN6263_c4_g1_i1.p1  ORF type:complete len:953 (+),score=221.58 TRINITY_DN6263_c4_g1_i1:66-2861(+)